MYRIACANKHRNEKLGPNEYYWIDDGKCVGIFTDVVGRFYNLTSARKKARKMCIQSPSTYWIAEVVSEGNGPSMILTDIVDYCGEHRAGIRVEEGPMNWVNYLINPDGTIGKKLK